MDVGIGRFDARSAGESASVLAVAQSLFLCVSQHPAMLSYDLLVVGGGPSGLSAAQTAVNLGRTVALFDSSSYSACTCCDAERGLATVPLSSDVRLPPSRAT